jgi:hypothetical protein
MDLVIGIFFLLAAFFAIYKIPMFATRGISKNWFLAAFAFKVVLAATMFSMYSRNIEVQQNADIFRYFEDSKVISHALKNKPSDFLKLLFGYDTDNPELISYYKSMNNWSYSNGDKLFSNNKLIIRYLVFINIFSFGSYYADIVISIFLSFTGLFWIFRFYNYHIKNRTKLLFALVFFFPSIAFWSSGILKESLIIFAIGLLLNCGNYALRKRKPIMRSFMVLLALTVIFNIKAFVLFILIPPLLAYLWNHIKTSQRTIIPYFILSFIAFSIASESGKIMNKSFFDLLIDKQLEFTDIALQNNAKSLISPIMFNADPISVVTNSPIALINTTFRPMVWEATNLQMTAASIENILILLILLLIVVFPSKQIANKNVFWFGLVFSISFMVIIGLSTPVLGALSRYRIPALLFLLLSMVQLVDTDRINDLLKKLKKSNGK